MQMASFMRMPLRRKVPRRYEEQAVFVQERPTQQEHPEANGNANAAANNKE